MGKVDEDTKGAQVTEICAVGPSTSIWCPGILVTVPSAPMKVQLQLGSEGIIV